MKIRFHPHAKERMQERGAAKKEVKTTILGGEQFAAKYGRMGFRRNFIFNDKWKGSYYNTKQIEVFAVKENNDWLVITVITRYF